MASIFAALLIGLFVGLGVGPVVHLLGRVLPTTDQIVTVMERDRVENNGNAIRRTGQFSTDRYSYYLTVADEGGTTRRIAVPRDLYDVALPGLMSLETVVLKEMVLLGLPVSVMTTSTFADTDVERYSLLIPVIGALIGTAFAFGIAGYLYFLSCRRRMLIQPIILGGMMLGAITGGLVWF